MLFVKTSLHEFFMTYIRYNKVFLLNPHSFVQHISKHFKKWGENKHGFKEKSENW